MELVNYYFEQIQSLYQQELKRYQKIWQEAPPGRLLMETVHGNSRLLHCVRDGRDQSGRPRYRRRVLKAESPALQALAKKEYARCAVQILQHNIDILAQAMQSTLPYCQDPIRDGMRPAYRSLPDNCFRSLHTSTALSAWQREWAEAEYEQSTYRPEEKIHVTSRGLKMRSRAEVIIAELLYKHNIPFRYEQTLLADGHVMAPDFTFPGRDEKEFYWEYCGMMGDKNYRKRQLWRRGVYESAGITEWDNMIYTYDVTDGIDVREIEAIIRMKILPRL